MEENNKRPSQEKITQTSTSVKKARTEPDFDNNANNINNVNNNNDDEQLPIFPPETFEQILNQVDERMIPICRMVCQTWKVLLQPRWENRVPSIKSPPYLVVSGVYEPVYVAVTKEGHILATGNGLHGIKMFDARGKFIREWGIAHEQGTVQTTESTKSYPFGIASNKQGHIFVADRNNSRIQMFNAEGQYLGGWGKQGTGEGEFLHTYGIVVDQNEHVLVTDYYGHRVQVFDQTGRYIRQWGREGTGDGKFKMPSGLALDREGNVYVADTYNNRVQVFTPEGQFLRKWGTKGNCDGQFNTPCSIAVSERGFIFVADTFNHRIQVFTCQGKFLSKWGGEGQFEFSPYCVAVNNARQLYVVDKTSIKVFNY